MYTKIAFEGRFMIKRGWASQIKCYGFGDLDAIDSGGKNAAGVTRTLAGRIKPFYVEAL